MGQDRKKARRDTEAISLVEDLLLRAQSPSATYRHFETLAYLKQSKFLAPYNAFLAMQQRKNPTVVLTSDQWLKHGRYPRPDVQPLVILRPFGPVSFVYDIADTEGSDLDVSPNMPTEEVARRIFPTDGWVPGLEERYTRLVDAARREGAAISEELLTPDHAGCARLFDNAVRPFSKKHPLERFSIEINKFHPVEIKLGALVHELAHIYCNHLGSRRPKDEKEVEAEAVAYAFCYRRGFRPKSEEYLAEYLTSDRPMPIGFWDTVLTALKKVEALEDAVEEKEGLPPLEFHFQIGGYMGNSYSVTLLGGKLRYEAYGQGYKLKLTEDVEVTAKAWVTFWAACNKHEVWAWEKHYPNPGICDGTQWSVVLENPYRRLESHGDNSYPAAFGGCDEDVSSTFRGFLRAVSKLLDGRPFE